MPGGLGGDEGENGDFGGTPKASGGVGAESSVDVEEIGVGSLGWDWVESACPVPVFDDAVGGAKDAEVSFHNVGDVIEFARQEGGEGADAGDINLAAMGMAGELEIDAPGHEIFCGVRIMGEDDAGDVGVNGV